MVYRAQQWECGIAGCCAVGAVSFKVLVQTPGSKAKRKKVSTDALRLCVTHANKWVDNMITRAATIELRGKLIQIGVLT
jgi:hypothetical protein